MLQMNNWSLRIVWYVLGKSIHSVAVSVFFTTPLQIHVMNEHTHEQHINNWSLRIVWYVLGKSIHSVAVSVFFTTPLQIHVMNEHTHEQHINSYFAKVFLNILLMKFQLCITLQAVSKSTYFCMYT